MSNQFKFFAAAAICLAGAAVAQPAPQPGKPGPDKAEMQRHAAEMCQDFRAHAVGEMAYLEAKLALTDKQKPLFERWKKIKLGAVASAECPMPPDGEPSFIDQMKHEEKMLRNRLDTLKVELPAMEALYASLSDEQKHAFHPAPPPRGGMRGPGMKGPGKDGPMDGPGMGDHGPGKDAPPPDKAGE